MTSNYLVVPARLAAKLQKAPKGYDVWADMTPKEVMMCRRQMDRRARDDIALQKWESRDINDSKD